MDTGPPAAGGAVPRGADLTELEAAVLRPTVGHGSTEAVGGLGRRPWARSGRRISRPRPKRTCGPFLHAVSTLDPRDEAV